MSLPNCRPLSPRRVLVGVVALVLGGLVATLRAAESTPDASAVARFASDVRPILVQHCLKCHGGEKTKGEFDLSTRGGLLHPGHEGANVVPGDSKTSRLMKFVRHEDEPYMPAKADKLSADAIAKIAAWIDAGAPYDKPLVEKSSALRGRAVVSEEDKRFWAFAPLGSPAVPKVKDAAWAKTPVDAFVLAKLEEKGIAPNGPAERRKLIRRAYLDLLGLPPPADKVESFVNDPSPDAWPKLIDELLASPQYGERYARHWLDLARFAESHGYEHDYDRATAFPYRDFVIKALNEDMPFDRFARLQIAGDELEPANPQAWYATGYLAAGTHSTQITSATAEKERYDEMDDMASTVGTSFLGMTVGCARCHDHKYDPIPTRDYYRLVATFTTTVRTEREFETDTAAYRKEKIAFDAKHAPLVAAVAAYEKEQLPARLEAWLAKGERPAAPKWVVLEMTTAKSGGGATMTKQPDGSYLVGGTRPQHDTYTFAAPVPMRGITAIKLDALADASFAKLGPGRADNGNFALSDFSASFSRDPKGSAPTPLKLKNPKATYQQKGLPVAATIDMDGTSAWAVDPQFGKDHAATWELETPLDLGDATKDGPGTITFTLKFANNIGHAIGRPRLSVTSAPLPATFDGGQGGAVALEIGKILDKKAGEWSEKDRETLLSYYRSVDPEYGRLNKVVQESLKKAPQPKKSKALVCSEGVPALRLHTSAADVPDFYPKTYLLKRGDPNLKDGEVSAGPLSVLVRGADVGRKWQVAPAKDSKLSLRRTALANWLTDVDAGAGHLLARVIVNRLWQHHTGRGIVATPNDFGVQGARPTHPELLDYLAGELIRNGWRLKPIHKLIMTSAVYTQSTDYDDARAGADRDNALHWRRTVRRLEGEAVRDSMLSVSGQLDPTMYGPGTLDESMRRRSVYFFVKRSKLVPMMMLFDWPDSLQGLGQRAATTVAPQALALMNHPQVQAYAAAFAKNLGPAAGESTEAAVRKAYATALSRPPDAEELAAAVAFIKEQAETLKADGKANATELALTTFCQTLFALNEFIYVE